MFFRVGISSRDPSLLLLRKHQLGISQGRADWSVRWAEITAAERKVKAGTFEVGLGPLGSITCDGHMCCAHDRVRFGKLHRVGGQARAGRAGIGGWLPLVLLEFEEKQILDLDRQPKSRDRTSKIPTTRFSLVNAAHGIFPDGGAGRWNDNCHSGRRNGRPTRSQTESGLGLPNDAVACVEQGMNHEDASQGEEADGEQTACKLVCAGELR